MSDRHNRTKTASVGKTASAGTIKYFDYSLLFIIIFLVGIGPIFNQRADPLELFPIANTARHIRSDKTYANPVIFFIHFCGK